MCYHGDGTGWESQLLETGFLAIFLCPVLSLRQLPRHSPTHPVIVWGYRWLIFRIMIGAVSNSNSIMCSYNIDKILQSLLQQMLKYLLILVHVR